MLRSTWKATERRVAALVGGKRTPLSGGNSLHTTGDIIHPTLYVEVKQRARFQILTLMASVEKEALREHKTPVLVLQESGRKVRYYMVREDDFLEAFAAHVVVTVSEKIDHVKKAIRKGKSDGHICHATGCRKTIPPAQFMCTKHWYMVPATLRRQVWALYEPGQEITKDASHAYLVVAREAIAAVAAKEDIDV